jgi:hypothetical protein
VFLAYVDESYSPAEYWLAALLVPVTAVNAALEELRRITQNAGRDFELTSDLELHGYELFHGSKQFKAVPPRARIDLYAKGIDTVCGIPGSQVVLRGVDRDRFRRRSYIQHYHPHRVAMAFLIESLDEVMCAASADCHAVIIADDHNETRTLLERDLRTFQEYGTWGYRGRRVTRIVDTVHFVRSLDSPLVQAVDLIGFLHLRRRRFPVEKDSRSHRSREAIWAQVEPRVCVRRIWP